MVYKHVNDVDLIVGLYGEAEELNDPNVPIGKVAICLIADVFHRLKIGDRFYYENGGLPNSFSRGILINPEIYSFSHRSFL